MEIGLAYTVQVALLQIPCVVLFSEIRLMVTGEKQSHLNSFPLVFPMFDAFAVFVSVFMISYVFIEGKSNYFKGSVILFGYIVFIAAFYLTPKE